MHSLSFDLHVELHGAQSKHRTLCHSHYQNSIIYVPLLYVVLTANTLYSWHASSPWGCIRTAGSHHILVLLYKGLLLVMTKFPGWWVLTIPPWFALVIIWYSIPANRDTLSLQNLSVGVRIPKHRLGAQTMIQIDKVVPGVLYKSTN